MHKGAAPYEAYSDSELIAAVVAGDEEATTYLLVRRCGPALRGLLRRYPSLGLEFDELVSEVFLLLARDDWQALRQFAGQNAQGQSCKLSSYVTVITSHALWRKMERAVKETAHSRPLTEEDDAILVDPTSAQRLSSLGVLDAVMALPNPIERQVVVQYKLQGRDVDEVARELKTTPANVYTICSRALKSLRSLLAEGGGAS